MCVYACLRVFVCKCVCSLFRLIVCVCLQVGTTDAAFSEEALSSSLQLGVTSASLHGLLAYVCHLLHTPVHAPAPLAGNIWGLPLGDAHAAKANAAIATIKVCAGLCVCVRVHVCVCVFVCVCLCRALLRTLLTVTRHGRA